MSYPITRAGPFAVPYSYTLGAAERFQVESISAVWNGAGASGSFLPCASVYTQDGKLLGRYKGDITVSAGDSFTEATFAPFLKGVPKASAPAASSAPSVATFYRSTNLGDAAQTIGAGATSNLTWLHAALPSDGSITGPIIGNQFASINIDCMADVSLRVGWEDGAYQKACVIGTNNRIAPADAVTAASYFSGASPLNQDLNDWTTDFEPDAFRNGDLKHCYVINGDAAPRDVNEAWLTIRVWPATGYTGIIPRWPQ